MNQDQEAKLFIKGFNAGYELEAHDQEIASSVYNGFKDVEHPYVKGFNFGVKELRKERAKHLDTYMSKLRSAKKSNHRSADPTLER